jgi:hypothetical protein
MSTSAPPAPAAAPPTPPAPHTAPAAPLMLGVSGMRGIVGKSLTPDVAAR